MKWIIHGSIVFAVLLLISIVSKASTDESLFIREIVQDPQPWLETSSGNIHMEPTYSALPEARVDIVDGSFSVAARRGEVIVSFTIERRAATELILTTPINANNERLKRIFVPDPKVISGTIYMKSIEKNEWSSILYEDGYAGRKWELWWGDIPERK